MRQVARKKTRNKDEVCCEINQVDKSRKKYFVSSDQYEILLCYRRKNDLCNVETVLFFPYIYISLLERIRC